MKKLLLLFLAVPLSGAMAFADGHSRPAADDPVIWGEEAPAPAPAPRPAPVAPPPARFVPVVPYSRPAPGAAAPVPAAAPGARTSAERTGADRYRPDGSAGGLPGEEEEAAPAVRVELGLRALGTWLTEDRKGKPFDGSYIGSINRLKAKRNWAPVHPYAQITFAIPGGFRLGAGVSYSHLGIETLDGGGGDGDIDSDILLGYLLLQRPVGRRFVPYAEVGGGMAFNSFDPVDSWAAGGKREFVLDDSPVFHAAGGFAVFLAGHLALDAYVRYLHCDIDGDYVFRGDPRPVTPFTFTASNVSAGLGLRYSF